MELEHVIYEVVDNIGVITLNRPEAANAQSRKVLEELDYAWKEADRDPEVKVIVLKSNGKHFSAGHDMSSTKNSTEKVEWQADSYYDWETRHYLHYAKTWRQVPKPSIAAVQGKCIAAGLMLCWPCDLIVAADNAQFSDPVLAMGICGVELHAHTWEFGPRKAKELLFTGDAITAQQAEQLGMVNRVVPLDELVPQTMALAQRIQGYTNSIDAIFNMHHFGHARAALVTGGIPSLAGLNKMRDKGKS
jgi:enoyl-CoA hydratase